MADTLQRPRLTMTTRERFAEVLLNVGFVAAVAMLWHAAPPGSFAIGPAVVCCLVLVVAARIRIDTPFGGTVPTQLAFVPLLFALPLAIVPLAVALAMALVRLPEILAGRMRLVRLVQAIPNAVFALGPVSVFVIAGVTPDRASPALLVAASQRSSPSTLRPRGCGSPWVAARRCRAVARDVGRRRGRRAFRCRSPGGRGDP